MSDDEETGRFHGTSVPKEDDPEVRDLEGTFVVPTHEPVHGGLEEKFTDDAAWVKLRDRVFVALAFFAMVAFGLTSFMVIKTNQTVSQINENQIRYVQAQNNAQICAQHDIVLAVKSIGKKLGLPVNDIPVPSIVNLECP